MNEETAREIFDHMFSLLESLETESAATLQLLKAKGFVTEDELAPHLAQAGNASSVRWRAARVRIEYLLSAGKIGQASAGKREQLDESQAKEAKPTETSAPAPKAGEQDKKSEPAQESKPNEQKKIEEKREAPTKAAENGKASNKASEVPGDNPPRETEPTDKGAKPESDSAKNAPSQPTS